MPHIGILITHGTDTLAWTHAFVRYSIKNNHANIVLTGSQIPMPSLGEFSDAYENLENSIRFLSALTPPNILTVFNYGKDAFSDSLRKIDRWENVAFVGDVVARMEWDEIKHHDKSIEIHEPTPMDVFHLITTGGTIEAQYNEEGVLVPGENSVLRYLTGRFSEFFNDISRDPVFAIDSSDVTFDRMVKICKVVEKCLKETNEQAYADLKFARRIKIVYADPFKTLADYFKETEDAKGIVIAGYGGGNITIDKASDQNVLDFISAKAKESAPVVLTSQVPIGISDIIYENGYEAVKSGAIPAIDLSIPECQIRLSYLVGHEDLIKDSANAANGYLTNLEKLFMSGMKFRTKKSRRMYEKLRGFEVCEEDLLINYEFQESVKMACDS